MIGWHLEQHFAVGGELWTREPKMQWLIQKKVFFSGFKTNCWPYTQPAVAEGSPKNKPIWNFSRIIWICSRGYYCNSQLFFMNLYRRRIRKDYRVAAVGTKAHHHMLKTLFLSALPSARWAIVPVSNVSFALGTRCDSCSRHQQHLAIIVRQCNTLSKTPSQT